MERSGDERMRLQWGGEKRHLGPVGIYLNGRDEWNEGPLPSQPPSPRHHITHTTKKHGMIYDSREVLQDIGNKERCYNSKNTIWALRSPNLAILYCCQTC